MKTAFFTLSLLAVLLLSGCASYERTWKAAATTTRYRDQFSGAWEGTWKSEKHRNAGGRLRCVLNRIDERHYHAHFKANWMAFSSTYKVVLDAEPRGRQLRFSGAHQLPKVFGGVYRYEGTATPRRFNATYHSSYDHGRFQMTRQLTSAAPIH